jgi:AraC family transcriptional regulator
MALLYRKFLGKIMQKPGDLLKSLLNEIEYRIKEDINADSLAASLGYSAIHLHRLFKFAFKHSLGSYIRSRKLTASLKDLLNTNYKLLKIAMEYGFEYEETYIRAFKREFGVTPGDFRKSGKIVRVKPPLLLLDENKLGNGILFGPDIVMVPQFHVIGKRKNIKIDNLIKNNGLKEGISFWQNERLLIKNTVNPNVYIGFINNINLKNKTADYMPSVQVSEINDIPQGCNADTFKSLLCARFRYMDEQINFYENDHKKVNLIYNKIIKTITDEKTKSIGSLPALPGVTDYTFLNDIVCFERINFNIADNVYSQIEWFTPVVIAELLKKRVDKNKV